MDKDYIKEEKSMDLSALRERLIAENEQKIWDEAREKFTQRKLEDVPLEELKEWLAQMFDTKRSAHPELSYSEWYLMCMRNEIYIRWQLAYTNDTDSWHLLNDIRNEIEEREEYKKWHPYEPLSIEEIAKYVGWDIENRTPEDIDDFKKKLEKDYFDIEHTLSYGTESLDWQETLPLSWELDRKILDTMLSYDTEDTLSKYISLLRLYREYLIKYKLNDVLDDSTILSALQNLVGQLNSIHKEKSDEYARKHLIGIEDTINEEFDESLIEEDFDGNEYVEDMDDDELKKLDDDDDNEDIDEELKPLIGDLDEDFDKELKLLYELDDEELKKLDED